MTIKNVKLVHECSSQHLSTGTARIQLGEETKVEASQKRDYKCKVDDISTQVISIIRDKFNKSPL